VIARSPFSAAWLVTTPLALIACLLSGCASHSSKLSIAPVQGEEAFTQSFSTAYARRAESGDFQVILLDDGIHTQQAEQGQPLHPTAAPPLRQVVQVRVFWRPMKGTKPNFPSASNAAIDWYVFGIGSREKSDMVHYQGVGFVVVGGSEKHPSVEIRSATLRPTARVGGIDDPIGKALVRGTIHAQTNAREVEDLQAQLRQSAEAAVALARGLPSPADASATAR
jgi:hypothetical protein